MAHPSRLSRQIPNVLSTARLASTPVLFFLAATRREDPFTWLLVAAMLSDIADGLIARTFHLTSRLGAQLDSIADLLLLAVSGYGVWVFHPYIVTDYWPVFAAWLAANLVELGAALLRYGRPSSFHALSVRIGAYLLGIFIGVLFLFGFYPWLMYLAVAVSVLGNLEELALIALLPQWRENVGGLWRVLRQRREVPAP
jgi:phosphatidylglycerophosphate synthase